MQDKKNYILKGIFILYLTGLCFCCFWDFRSSIDLNSGLFGILNDKVVHFLLFFPMPFIAYFAFPRTRDTKRKFNKFCVSVFLLGTAVGAATEIVQGWTGYRSKDIIDLAADCCGLVSGIGCIQLVDILNKRRKRAIK